MADPEGVSGEPALGEGMVFEGLLVLPKAARIDGRVVGEVLAAASLEVGETGVVEAELEVSEAIIRGRVRGGVRARASVSLGPDAVVDGDIAAPRLAIAEGARVNGCCHCGEPVADGGVPAGTGPERPDPARPVS